MKAACALRRAMRAAARTGIRARRAAGASLLAGLAGFVAGCGGGGAAAPVQAPAGAAVPGPERAYVVGRGDTLYSIAWRHGIDYRSLAGANSIRDPYTIFPGQRLHVPEPGEIVPPDPSSEPEQGAVASEPPDSDNASAQGAGTTQTPVVTPLPPPEPESSTKPSREAPAQPRQSGPEAASKPAAAASPPKAPREASAPLAARTVAGLRWTRPTRGKTISTFGRSGNKGIDFAGEFEQPIRSAAPGRVVYAGSGLIGYGKLVIVKHNNRLLSAYAHNESLHVGEGTEVKGGQHIADMGRSSKGRIMLHFEIRRDGKPVDPLPFLP